MGKPYETEIAKLPSTYEWAIKADVTSYARAIHRTIDHPLFAVGSGGSLTAAHLVAALHEFYTGSVARAVTPLEIVGAARRLDRAAVLFVSAGGSNPDVVDAFKLIVAQEPRATIVLSGRTKSALAQAASAYRRGADFLGFDLPVAKDGYLATNSLLAFALLTWRAYAKVFEATNPLPSSLDELLGTDFHEYRRSLATSLQSVLSSSSLVLLHGVETAAAAIDVESRFVEAALGHVHFADFRNFAHGRHLWLARYAKESAVITLETARDKALALRTTRLLPKTIPLARIGIEGQGAHAAVGAVVTAMLLAAEAGRYRGVDPGRPRVPEFGRRLYRLRGLGTVAALPLRSRSIANSVSQIHTWAAVRKQRVATGGVIAMRTFGKDSADIYGGTQSHIDWELLAGEAARRIMEETFRAVVFDYDGTLCDEQDRFRGLSSEVLPGVELLLDHGIDVGIATGRGRSVHTALRQVLSRRYWKDVVIGYYNGSEVRSLKDDAPEKTELTREPSLLIAYEALVRDARVTERCVLTTRATQLTLELKSGARESDLWDIVSEIIAGVKTARLSVLRSSHSIDVLAEHVSKLSVVRQMGGPGRPLLCIGDRGRFPGNDYELLATPHTLSVDEVSGAAHTCWNFAPAGTLGVAATAFYLSRFRVVQRAFTVEGL